MKGPVASLFVLLAIAIPAFAGEVGFASVSVPTPSGASFDAGIWYPSLTTASDQQLGLQVQRVAPNAAVDGGGHGLIVISHGASGSLDNHYDTAMALARAGFVVASLTHPGDNWRDHSQVTNLAARPRAVHALIDYLLTTWPGHAAIDPAKIGMFGFSAGGFTALVLVGGVPDLAKVAPYCAVHAQDYPCGVLREHPGAAPVAAADWLADQRIKAAVVVAPAIGYVFAPRGLAGVKVPIQLWRAENDQFLPSPNYVEPVRDALPQPPEYHVALGADHLDFLAPCSEDLAHYVPAICEQHAGFDRSAFHQAFNAEVSRFLQQALAKRP